MLLVESLTSCCAVKNAAGKQQPITDMDFYDVISKEFFRSNPRRLLYGKWK